MNGNSTSVLVLAAGMGSRFGGLKQLARFGPGKHTILDYSLFDACRCGFRRALCVIQEAQRGLFDDLLAPLREHMKIEYVYQSLNDIPREIAVPSGRFKPWGTAHAVYAARKHIQTPFVTINADDFYGRLAWEEMATFTGKNPSANALLSFRLDQTLPMAGAVARGICCVEGKYLRQIEEFLRVERLAKGIRDGNSGKFFRGDEPTSLNFWYLQPQFFSEMNFAEFASKAKNLATDEWMLPVVIQDLMVKEKLTITIVQTQSRWLGITHPTDGRAVDLHIRNAVGAGDYPEKLWR
jgi:hypothetical protein